MRKFYLINEMNIRFDLQDLQNGAFFTQPSGLGYDNGLSYVRVGNAFKKQSSELRQSTPGGTITFNGYQGYQDFVNYIENSEELRLIYAPLDIEFYRDIDMDSISKSELSGNWLQCPIKFNCKGLYYTENSQEYVIEEIEGVCRFPLPFGTQFNDYTLVLFDFYNGGHADGEILAEFHGYIQKPTLELYVNGILKSKMLFNITVEVGQKLLYSAKSNRNYVKLQDVDGTQTNVITCLSLENDNFFKIPKGISSLKLSSESGASNKSVISVLTPFKGV